MFAIASPGLRLLDATPRAHRTSAMLPRAAGEQNPAATAVQKAVDFVVKAASPEAAPTKARKATKTPAAKAKNAAQEPSVAQETGPARESTGAKHDVPKKAPGAYLLYVRDRMAEIKASTPANQKLVLTTLTKTLAAEWKGLSDAAKKPYLEHAERLRGPAAELKASKRAEKNAERKAASDKKAAGKAARKANAKPPNMYSAYVKENFPRIQADNPGLRFQEVSALVAKQWKTVSEQEKAQRKKSYLQQVAAWEAKQPNAAQA